MLLSFRDISMAMKRAQKLPCRTENTSSVRKSEEKSLSETQAAYCDVREHAEYRKQATDVAMDWTIPVNHRKIPGGGTDH